MPTRLFVISYSIVRPVWLFSVLVFGTDHNSCSLGLCGNANGNAGDDLYNKYGKNCARLPLNKRYWCVGNTWAYGKHSGKMRYDVYSSNLHSHSEKRREREREIDRERGERERGGGERVREREREGEEEKIFIW